MHLAPELAWLMFLVPLLCGLLVGFSLALTGAGGSTLAVPLLMYVVGMNDVHLAIGTSAIAVSINAYANLIPHARAGNVRWRQALIFTLMGIIGATIGSEFGKWVNGTLLTTLFALLVMIVAVFMVLPKHPGKPDNSKQPNGKELRLSATGLGEVNPKSWTLFNLGRKS